MRKTLPNLISKSAAAATVTVLLIALSVLFSSCTKEKEPNRRFTIGLITNNRNGLQNIKGFQEQMAELGYRAGDNVDYLYEGAPVKQSNLDAALKKMLNANVDLIFTAGTPTGIAAHKATSGKKVPVIFGVIADPVAAGVITDLAHPGSNITGVKLGDTQARRLSFLKEVAPGIKQVLIPYNPNDVASTSAIKQVKAVVDRIRVTIIEATARNDKEVIDLLGSIPENVDAVFLVPGTTVNAHLRKVLDVTRAGKIPVSGPSFAQVKEGAVMTYGFNHEKAGSQAARMADQVLRGTDPGDLPVETAEFFLAINLKAAQLIGLQVPYSILQQAAIIIRPDQ